MQKLSATVCLVLLCGPALSAGEFSYGDARPVAKFAETFQGKRCYVSVRGGTVSQGGSAVKGAYFDPQGELKIFVDRFSHLTIRGEARKVTITYVDTNSGLDLSGLRIGSGGVVIHSVDQRSVVELGVCQGGVVVKSVDNGSSLTVLSGTKVQGNQNFHHQSRLHVEK